MKSTKQIRTKIEKLEFAKKFIAKTADGKQKIISQIEMLKWVLEDGSK